MLLVALRLLPSTARGRQERARNGVTTVFRCDPAFSRDSSGQSTTAIRAVVDASPTTAGAGRHVRSDRIESCSTDAFLPSRASRDASAALSVGFRAFTPVSPPRSRQSVRVSWPNSRLPPPNDRLPAISPHYGRRTRDGDGSLSKRWRSNLSYKYT